MNKAVGKYSVFKFHLSWTITMDGLHFLLLLSSLALSLSLFYVPASSAAVFTSLNCGSSTTTTDSNFIVWLSDDLYIQNGESHTVTISSQYASVMNTLRAFTTRKKNCYSFEVDKGSRILLRASFLYGNYDRKSSPPTFEMHFDGNYWTTVETSSTDLVYYEVDYIVKGDHVSLCLAQTKPNQFPFISALEIRSMETSVYSDSDSDKPLYLIERVAFGAKDTVRFPSDSYDRMWIPVSSGVKTVTSDAIFISTSDSDDNPPRDVLRNGVTASSSSSSLSLRTGLPYSTPVPIYMNMYFSEVTRLGTSEKRSFQTSVNDNIPANEPVIIPPYGGVIEMYISNMTASSSTTFDLVPTSSSTLPPLINAMEVFMVGSTLSEGTSSNDVKALVSLQNSFIKLQDWSGDPCLPSPYTWDWVACSDDSVPRITALLLGNLGLVGTLPDFSDMDALETIDLSKNSLIGEIPDFLGTMLPKLTELNLADNDFSGTVPSSLSNNKNIKLDTSGNSKLCASGESCKTTPSGTGSGTSPGTGSGTSPGTGSGTSPDTGKKKSILPIILGAVIAALGLLVIVALVVLLLIHNKRKKAAMEAIMTAQSSGMPGVPLQQMPTAGPSNAPMHPGMYNGQAYQNQPGVAQQAMPTTGPTSNAPVHPGMYNGQVYNQDVPASHQGQGYHQN